MISSQSPWTGIAKVRLAGFIRLVGWLAVWLTGAGLFAQTTPPYFTNFETSDGFTLGSLHAQNGWQVSGGAAEVDTTMSLTGLWSVRLAPTASTGEIAHAFSHQVGAVITYIDFYARPAAASSITQSTLIDTESSGLTLLRLDYDGHILAFDGDGVGGGHWVLTGVSIPVGGDGQATAWMRFTLRQDYAAHKWDLSIDGNLVAHGLGFRDNTQSHFSTFRLKMASVTVGYLDDFYAGSDNPLMVDIDKDGMADGWESTHGLNSSLDDRAADFDIDGLSNIEEYALETGPDEVDTDADGLPDGWEVERGVDPLTDDAASDPGEVGRTLLQSYQQNLSPWPSPTVAVGLNAWYRADRGVTADGNGKVSRWMDLSGHARHVEQVADTWRQPLLEQTAMNGHAAILYTGGEALVTREVQDIYAGSNDFTVIVVLRPGEGQQRSGNVIYFGGEGQGYYFGSGIKGTTSNYFMHCWPGQFGPSAALDAGRVQVLTAVKAATLDRIYVNGSKKAEAGVVEVVGYQPDRLVIGNSSYPYYGYNGQIAEVLVYNRELNDVERGQVEAALMAKYLEVDGDGDGLPDAWEMQYFGTLAHGANADPGAMGRTLLASFQQNLSPWPTATVAGGLRAWYRADAGVAANGNGKVSRWVDVSGQSRHVEQTTDTWKQPLLEPAAMNGHAAIAYNGGGALVTREIQDVYAGSNDFTVVAVVRPGENQQRSSNVVYLSEAGQGYYFGSGIKGTTGNYYMPCWPGEFGPSVAVDAGRVQVLTAVKAAAAARMYVNGSKKGEAVVTEAITHQLDRVAIGNSSYPYYGYSGQIAEVLVYNRALTDVERAQVEAALMAKYLEVDGDGDGLSDDWEMQYFGVLTHGASADPGSVGRTLLVSYQQNLSPWPATTVAGGLSAWYRADAGVTADGNGKVSRWADLSGHGRHVEQITDTWKQPMLAGTAMNGHAAIAYDGGGALATREVHDAYPESNDFTVVAVVRPGEGQQRSSNVVYLGEAGQGYFGSGLKGTTGNYYMQCWPGQDGPRAAVDPGRVQVLTAVKAAAIARMYVNGTKKGDATVTETITHQPDRLVIGNSSHPYYGYNGQIAEVLVYNRALTDVERAQIEAALMAKYLETDGDGDGLSDDWEMQYFGTLALGASEDPGSVGRTLLVSHQQGLNPWPAATVSAGLGAWYRADMGVTADGNGKVSRWADVSGQSRHIEQVLDTWKQPVLEPAVINDHAALSYDGGAALITREVQDIYAGSDDFTVIAVMRPEEAQQQRSNVVYLGEAAQGYFGSGLRGTTGNYYAQYWPGGAGPAVALAPGQVQIVSAVKAAATGRMYVNGAQQGEMAVTATIQHEPDRIAIGNSSHPYYGYNGHVAEVLIYNRVLTAAERHQIETALIDKYLENVDPPPPPDDSDGNGLPDLWEQFHFGQTGVDPNTDPDGDGLSNLQEQQQGSNPKDFFNGEKPVLQAVNGVRQTRRSGFFVQPTVIQVFHADGSTPWPNAPVVFSIMEGEGLWAVSSGGATSSTLEVRANATGQAIAYYWLP